MSRIAVLSEIVANQIAAGEVVVRPANVVKELVENAVDAGARSIRVETAGGGVVLIGVTDDGHGMDRVDTKRCIERHATSKLREADDLSTLATLGFRGEALPSIASVSRMTIRSRPREQNEGTEVTIVGGHLEAVQPCGCSPGTRVVVEDLFFNVPARRKFLRATSTESAHITEVLRAVALAHPTIHFTHHRDGRRTINYLATQQLAERARSVLGHDDLFAVEGTRGPITIEGFLAPARAARSRSNGLMLYVNRRPVQERSLIRAVANAYGDQLSAGQFPVGALFVNVPSDLVDVNVHPQKAEVRFAHARAVTDAVYSTVVRSMPHPRPSPNPVSLFDSANRPTSTGPSSGMAAAAPTDTEAPWDWTKASRQNPPSDHHSASASAYAEEASEIVPPAAAAKTKTTGSRLVGLVRQRDLVVETATDLLVVQPDALYRRTIRQTLERQLQKGPLSSQMLLFPTPFPTEDLDPATPGLPQMAARFGIDIRQVSDRVVIGAVPRSLPDTDPAALLRALFVGPSQLHSDERLILEALVSPLLAPSPVSIEQARRWLAEFDLKRDTSIIVGRLPLDVTGDE